MDRALEGRGKGGEALGGLGEVWKRVGRMRGLRNRGEVPLAGWENGGEV